MALALVVGRASRHLPVPGRRTLAGLVSTIECPNCGHTIEMSTLVTSALDCYRVVQRGGMSSSAYASRRGVGPSMVTLWRRLGICLVDIGVDPDSVLWKDLSYQNRGQWAGRSQVARVIETPGVTVEQLRALVDQLRR